MLKYHPLRLKYADPEKLTPAPVEVVFVFILFLLPVKKTSDLHKVRQTNR